MIAMALAGKPDLLVADEPTTALDATIQAQILELLTLIRRETGMALVLISHDLGVISQTCDRVCVMYAGRIIETADAVELFDQPLHPYTQGLIAALPPLEGVRRRLDPIDGNVPEPWNLPPGCAFGPRCPRHGEACDAGVPALVQKAPDRFAACIKTPMLQSARSSEFVFA
jgi:peptide/nickel transport system ATP-binding protein